MSTEPAVGRCLAGLSALSTATDTHRLTPTCHISRRPLGHYTGWVTNYTSSAVTSPSPRGRSATTFIICASRLAANGRPLCTSTTV